MDLTIRTDEDLESDSGLDAGDDRLEFEELDGTDALVPGINFFLLVLKNSYLLSELGSLLAICLAYLELGHRSSFSFWGRFFT